MGSKSQCLPHGQYEMTHKRPHSHCSVFVEMRFRSIKATRSHYSVFVQKRREKHPFLCVHIDQPDNKYVAKDIRFCAFALLRFCEAHCSILQRLQKPPFWCAFTLIKCVFKNLSFYGYRLLTAFLKTSVFVALLCISM